MFNSGPLKSHWKNPHKMNPAARRLESHWEALKSQNATKESHRKNQVFRKIDKIRENFRFNYVLRAGFQWEEFAPSQSHVSANIEIRGQGGNPTRGTG